MSNTQGKPWSQAEVERLKELLKTNSRTKSIKLFAAESGKSTDAVRRKLLRIEKVENVKSSVEQTVVSNDAVVERTNSENNEPKQSIFRRFLDMFR